jgi:hypothetical protein
LHYAPVLAVAAVILTIVPIAGASADSASDPLIPAPLLLNFLDYTFYLNDSQIFANDTIKSQVLDNQSAAQYNIPKLEHEIFGSTVNATDVRVNVTPTIIDDDTTRLDLEIFAQEVNVTNGRNLHYENVQLQAVYGIYDKRTDLIEMHVPIDVALAYLGQQ